MELKGLRVDVYTDVEDFIKNLDKYSKDTKIVTDNNLGCNKIDGFELAKKLNEIGYIRLYMISGNEFSKNEIPSYLKVMLKEGAVIDKLLMM